MFLKPLSDVKQLTDLVNRPKEEKLSVIERQTPGASFRIASLLLQKIETVFRRQISGDEIVLATELILDQYIDLTIADLQLFTKEIAREKMFGEINVNKIVVAFTEFYVRRENACADYREREHQKRKHHSYDIDMEAVYTRMQSEVKAQSVKAKEPSKPILNIDNLFKT